MRIISYTTNDKEETSPLRIKDKQFLQIQELIDSKRKFLCNKQTEIRKIQQQNEYLYGVKDDYSKYNEYIMREKMEQIKAFQLLDKYIKDLTNSGELSERNLEDAEMEQQKILKQIESIKKNLDILTNDVDSIKNRNFKL